MTTIKFDDLNAKAVHLPGWRNSFSAAAQPTAKRIAATELDNVPFEHIIVPDVFPTDVYQLMIDYAIEDRYLRTLDQLGRTSAGSYPNRWVLPLSANMPVLSPTHRAVWEQVYDFMTNLVAPALLSKFGSVFRQRHERLPEMHMDVLYVRDRQGYELGPHTDSSIKICTFLVYLAQPGIDGPGTSLYRPRDPNFRCEGGPHYTTQGFELVKTAPYRANVLCGFAKTDRSFHGVEKIVDNTTRNLLICDVQIKR